MKKLVATAAAFQAFCDANRLPFCFIGGFALQAHGEPRVTLDVDASVYTGFERDDATGPTSKASSSGSATGWIGRMSSRRLNRWRWRRTGRNWSKRCGRCVAS